MIRNIATTIKLSNNNASYFLFTAIVGSHNMVEASESDVVICRPACNEGCSARRDARRPGERRRGRWAAPGGDVSQGGEAASQPIGGTARAATEYGTAAPLIKQRRGVARRQSPSHRPHERPYSRWRCSLYRSARGPKSRWCRTGWAPTRSSHPGRTSCPWRTSVP